MAEGDGTEGLEFKWGELKGTGGKNRDVKFYRSFKYGEEWYELYDCVYLFKEGEAEPEIGKIIKIWETPQRLRKVKVLWFFRPYEIINFLGDEKILENELFLASGVGPGLSNLNPLEAIAGKCNVLCISKDKENPQPSDEELQKAEFVFYRTFDVAQQKIMDKIEGKIADVDVKFLFNRINIQKPAGDLNVDLGKNKVSGNDSTSNEAMIPSKQNSFKEHMNLEIEGSSVDKYKLSAEKLISAVGLESSEMDKTDERQQDVSSPKTIFSVKGRSREEEVNLDNGLPRKLEVEETRFTKDVGDLGNRPTKKVKLDTSKESSDKRNSDEQRHAEVEENSNGRKINAILECTQPEKANMNASRSSEHRHKMNANGSYMKDLSLVASLVDERCKLKGVEDTVGTNTSPTKRMSPDGNASNHSNNKLPNSSHGVDESKVHKASSPSSSIDDDDKCKRKYGGESLDPKKKMKVGDETKNLSLSVDKDSKKKMKVGDKATNLPLAADKDSKKKMKVGDKATNLPLAADKDSKKKMEVGDKATNLPLAADKDSKKKMEVGDKATNLPLAADKDSKKKMEVGDKATNLPLAADKDSKKKMEVVDKATHLSIGKPPRPSPRPPQSMAQKFDGQALEVTQRSDASNVDGNQNKSSSSIAFGSNDSLGNHKAPLEKMKSNVKAPRLSNRELGEQSTPRLQIKSQKLNGQVMEGTQRPCADKTKWFKDIPWQERMQIAKERGTLILVQNLDPAYTSAEVEDILWNGFGERCTAKMIQQTANSSPYYGRALVILNTRETAKKVVRRLGEGCLLLPNGRPLVGSIETPCSTEKKPNFFGHLVIDKLRLPMLNEREMREAVSTSHFSQPNTIEYDMSMEWCQQQEKTELTWKRLFQQQWKEVRELKSKLKAE